MSVAKVSIIRPIMMTMILSLFVVFGIVSFVNIPLNLMPDVDIPVIVVSTVYPGANASDIESQITKKVEDEVATISEIDYMNSYSMDGISLVQLVFKMSKDIEVAKTEVRDKVAAIRQNLPGDSYDPVIEKYDPGATPVIEMVLSGNVSGRELYDFANISLKQRFSQIKGVAKVSIIGGDERQIKVMFDNSTLKSNKLSMATVGQIIAGYNVDLPSGNYERGKQDFTVKYQGKFKDISAINEVEIPTSYGYKKLGEIAVIKDTVKSSRSRAMYYNNERKELSDNIVTLSLIKSADGNPVEIAKNIKNNLDDINKILPAGMELTVVNDLSEFIDASVDDTLSNILLGIIFTGLILLLFLHDWRSTLIVAISMPFSIIGTIGIIKYLGYSLNMMTLMALSSATGIIVTNSVVVIENIFKHMSMGHSKKKAAEVGADEVLVSVIASALTNMAVFIPIASMNSMVGQFFKEFAVTVVVATVFSLVSSFTITPMLSGIILPDKPKVGKLGIFIDKIIKKMESIYQSMLHHIIDKKVYATLTLLVTLVILIISLKMFGAAGMEFSPLMDRGDISAKIELPLGYNLAETEAKTEEILAIINQNKEVLHTTVTLGQLDQTDQSVNLASMNIKMIDAKLRPELSSTKFAQKLNKDLAMVDNADIRVSAVSGSGGGGDPIEIYLQGQEMDKLIEINDKLAAHMKDFPGVAYYSSSYRSGKIEYVVTPKLDKMSDFGLLPGEVSANLRYAVDGISTTNYTDRGEDYEILVSLNESEIKSSNDIRNIPLVGLNGKSTTVDQISEVDKNITFDKIMRRDKYKSIKIGIGNLPGYGTGLIQKEITKELIAADLPSGYTYSWGGDSRMMNDTVKDMAFALAMAILLTYMLLAAILESFTQPFIIMVTLPLGVIGVGIIMYLTGTMVNIISMLAIMMLVGIVVNNAILIMDYYNVLHRKQGKPVRESLVIACVSKLRPILMSSLAIIIGMMPMALGIGSAGKEIRQGMGLVNIGGIVSSMILTMFVLPAMVSLSAKKSKK